ncbi:leucine-rich repeat-containing protein 74A-like [Lineus longissimus]|uniref:leucine-rich repeat-containing protein 74A-like n=1 Tax=Lineus longissimus TaxID=88925 RepID=UPI002B4D645A
MPSVIIMGDQRPEPSMPKGILKKPKSPRQAESISVGVLKKPRSESPEQPVSISRPCTGEKNEDLESRVSEPRSSLSYQNGNRTPVPRQSKSATLRRTPTPKTKAKTKGEEAEFEHVSGESTPIMPVETPPVTPMKSPKTTPPEGKKRLSIKEMRELRAEVIRRRRLAKGEFPDNDDIKPRRPGQLPWRKKKDTPMTDITNESDLDSDLEEELKLLELAGNIRNAGYDPTGKQAYLDACAKYETTPISTFIKGIENKELILRYRGIGTRGARALASALEVNPNMEHVILSGNFIESQGGFYISEALRDNAYVTELDLAENYLGGVGACAICDMLCDNKVLVELDLSGNSLEDSDAAVFQHMLMENRHLKKLRLAHNHFEDVAGRCFGDALVENCTLESLDLSWNHLRLNGAKRLCHGIQENIGLKRLDVSMNGFGIEGAQAMAAAIKINRSLLRLNMSRNRIPETGGTILGESLKVNETLKVFKCARNPILPDGAMNILLGIDKNAGSAMEFLDLSDDFVRKDFVELKDKLEKDRVMRILHGTIISDLNFEPEQNLVMELKTGIMDDPMTKVRNYCDKAGLRLIDLFKQFDKDQSMSLTREEIRKGIKVKKIKMSKKEIDALLDQLDTDGDGEIDYAELVFGDKMHRGVKRRVKAMNIERTRRMSILAEMADPTIKVVNKQVSMSELVDEVLWIEDNRAEWHKKVVGIKEERIKESSSEDEDDDKGRIKGVLGGTA